MSDNPSPCFICAAPAESGHIDEIFVLTPILHVRCTDKTCLNYVLRYGQEHWERLCREAKESKP